MYIPIPLICFTDPASLPKSPPKQSLLAFLCSFSFWGTPLLATLFAFLFVVVLVSAFGDDWFDSPHAVPDSMVFYFGEMGVRLLFILGLPMTVGTLAAYFARRRNFPLWGRHDLLSAMLTTSLLYFLYTGEVFPVVFSLSWQFLGFHFASGWAKNRLHKASRSKSLTFCS